MTQHLRGRLYPADLALAAVTVAACITVLASLAHALSQGVSDASLLGASAGGLVLTARSILHDTAVMHRQRSAVGLTASADRT